MEYSRVMSSIVVPVFGGGVLVWFTCKRSKVEWRVVITTKTSEGGKTLGKKRTEVIVV